MNKKNVKINYVKNDGAKEIILVVIKTDKINAISVLDIKVIQTMCSNSFF